MSNNNSISTLSISKYPSLNILFIIYIIRFFLSIFSSSYIHPDEIFQSIEIIQSISIYQSNSHIPWEFANCINPCRSIIPP